MSQKLVLAILLTGAVPLVAGLSASYYRGSSELQEVIGAGFRALAEVSASKVDAKIEQLVADGRAAAELAATNTAVRAWLLTRQPASEAASEARYYWPPISESDIVPASWLTRIHDVKSGAPEKTTIRLSGLHADGTSRQMLHISLPVYDANRGWPVGRLHYEYDIKQLFDPLIYPIRFGKTGHVMLMDQHGTIISCPLLATGSRIEESSLIRSVVTAQAGWISAENDGHGEPVFSIVGHAPLSRTMAFLPETDSLHMFVWQDSDEIFAPTRSLLTGVSIAGLLAITLLVGMGYYASRRIVNPIRKLRREASLIAAGDLSQPLLIETGDEIEELASEFEKMRLQLRQHIGSLEQKVKERTRKLIESQAERERVMEQLIQSEKMAAVGTLASGIGHEINNPLYVITGLAEAVRDGKDISSCREYGREILKHGRDISAIVRNLSGYAHPASREDLEEIDLHEKLLEAVNMVQLTLLDDRIEIRQHFSPLPKISAHPEEIQQVFFNIIRNGVQAMEGAGLLELATSHEGNRACVRIRDNGRGIKAEHRGRIFDPFFTTKGPEAGEGMGMFVVKTIINKYRGTISVESREGIGTEFTICFPCDGETAEKTESDPA